ncbi:phytanoyl- dioxygenase [Ophiostoma piceae UAMH 11346]|uniref:Phytanoyl-dioxygenase n=1 Tax=Ophiostoma piceae (strain UAMH 11346) TaxID=1262450 RepID=S3BS01_OPHP1|nr:phytanoyl- dioxygenase [Ophiostoma piceae UAMH 11346]
MLERILNGEEVEGTPEWLLDLKTKGWTVVPGVLSPEKAAHYAGKGYEWLESWGLGFDRSDPSTRKVENLPYCTRGGLYNRYGLAHEQFIWDLKSEPSLIEKFAQVWGTEELLVSFDGLNLSVADRSRPKTDPIFAPWAHVDQCPDRTTLHCVQGILNFLDNGPDDGGLTVLEGSHKYYSELWKHFDDKKGPTGWSKSEYQSLDPDMSKWLEGKGCKWVKICAKPGDLLLWESRTVHYGSVPAGTSDRFAAYVCYKPASQMNEKTRQDRLDAFAKKECTAHDPTIVRTNPRLPPNEHPTYNVMLNQPLQQPVLSKRAKQLIGIEAY